MADVPAMSAAGLARAFGETRAVRGLDLAVAPGELYGLVGPDGAGKTTTLRLLTGLLVADAGEARIFGDVVHPEAGEVRERIGYMPQAYGLYGDLSVDENLDFFGRLFGVPRDEHAQRKARLLEITRLSRFGDRRAEALSGGMYKKLALACALLHRPRVLLLDEPTNGVDPVSRRELWDLLYEFVGEGMAVLVATPYMDEAERCHRVGLLHEGRLLAEGDPGALARAFEHQVYLLHTDRRDALEAALDGRADVIAFSPQGSALRVVVRGEAAAAFEGWARPQTRDLEAVRPSFEDLFLARLGEGGEAA